MTKLLCLSCKHYIGELACEAFPIRIPKEILLGTNDHKEVQPGQIDEIVYEMSDQWIADLSKIPDEQK